jgi:phosphoketolase
MYIQAMEVPWRQELSSINYVESSTWARQEHNGFSHQNPSFIGAVLNLKPTVARVYLPPDANCFLSVWLLHSFDGAHTDVFCRCRLWHIA